MNPFYFGESKRPLFGIHAPARGTERGAVLLCYPFAGEYMRAHRAFRQLTNLLTRSGYHVLRFDYSCTGDSAGDLETASVELWLQDIDAAIEELKEATGFEQISIAGLRLGATLAARASVGRKDIDRLVLWDPIVVGSTYGRELRAAASPSDSPAVDGVLGIGGFPVRQTLLEAISTFDLNDVLDDMPPTDLVISEEDSQYSELRMRLERGAGTSRFLLRPSPNHWMEGDAFGSALIPGPIIEGVVQCLTGGKQG